MKLEFALKLEELAFFCVSLAGFLYLGGTPVLFILLLLVPDLGILGYLINPLVGAYTYNFTHWKVTSISVTVLGIATGQIFLVYLGLAMFAHSSLDRVFGIGLKFRDRFSNTHLGYVKNISETWEAIKKD